MTSPGLNINLRDPAVQRLMSRDARDSHSSGKRIHGGRELVQLGGDPAAAPSGLPQGYSQESGASGMRSTVRMTESAAGHPVIYYSGKHGEFVLEGDLYAFPGQPMKLVLICPVCSVASGKDHGISITSDKKAIEYDPSAGDPELGGLLSVAPFECTWELNTEKAVDVNGNPTGAHDVLLRSDNLCRWKVAIDNNIARDV